MVMICFSAQVSSAAQPCCILDMGIFNFPVNSNKLEIRIQPTLTINTGNYSNGTFTVRYQTSYGVTVSLISSTYGYLIPPSAQGSNNGYTYLAFTFNQSNLIPVPNPPWPAGQGVLVAVLEITNNPAGGTGIFELTNDMYANSITNGGAFYQELAYNGINGGGNGQQGSFYQTSTSAPLPVELSTFTATALPDRTVALDWTAVTERDLAYYGVEHSTDGSKFSELDQVTAAGTTSVATTYTYLHSTPQPGTNYYRLRMVNTDGTFEYSPIRSAELDGQRHHFSLVPTPTTGPLALMSQHLEQYPDGLRYKLTDNSGKLLQTDVIRNEKTDFNLSAYAAGFYYLTVFTDQEQLKQFKVIVTKD